MNNKSIYNDCTISAVIYMALIALLYLFSVVGQFITSLLFEQNGVAFYVFSSLYSIISIIIAVYLYSRLTKERVLKPLSVKKFKPIYLLFAIGVFAGTFFGLGFVNSAVANLILKLGGRVNSAQIPLDTVWQLILFIFCYALLPAVFEEVFFRGIMLDGLKGVKTIWAVIISSLCFALYHGSFTQLIYQFVCGACLALLAIKSKSVVPGAIAHFLNNFTVLLFGYLGVDINFFALLPILLGLITLFVTIFGLIYYDREKNLEKTDSVKKFFLPYGVIIIAFCLITCVLSAVNL